MTDYLRAGKQIGIIGGQKIGFLLAMKAKTMGFEINLLDPDPDCQAAFLADHFIQADYHDSSALERLGLISDVVTYTVDNLDVETLALSERHLNIPQSTDLLALTKDRLLLKGFLEECGVNTLPYATIIQMTDIEEKIDGIGYPCYVSNTRSDEKIYLEDPTNLFDILDLVKDGTCILEAVTPGARRLSVTVARNEQGHITVLPAVEHIYDDERLVETIAVKDYLPLDLQEEIYRIGRLIAENLENRGSITLELLLSETGLVFVDNIIPVINDKALYTQDTCIMDVFEVHLRSICNWPLMEKIELLHDVIIYHVIAREVTLMQRQIQHHPNWKFYFYNKDSNSLQGHVGHITVINNDLQESLDELNQIMR